MTLTSRGLLLALGVWLASLVWVDGAPAACGCRCVGTTVQPYCDNPIGAVPVCPPTACLDTMQKPPKSVITPAIPKVRPPRPVPPALPDSQSHVPAPQPPKIVQPKPLLGSRGAGGNPVRERLDQLNRQNKVGCPLAPVRNPRTGTYQLRRSCS